MSIEDQIDSNGLNNPCQVRCSYRGFLKLVQLAKHYKLFEKKSMGKLGNHLEMEREIYDLNPRSWQ